MGKPLKMIMTFDNEDDHYHHDDHYFGDDHFKIRACDNFFFVGVVVMIMNSMYFVGVVGIVFDPALLVRRKLNL